MENKRCARFLQAVKAVLWSMLGVRKNRDHQADFAQINPVYWICAVLMCGLAFIMGIWLVVRLALAS